MENDTFSSNNIEFIRLLGLVIIITELSYRVGVATVSLSFQLHAVSGMQLEEDLIFCKALSEINW